MTLTLIPPKGVSRGSVSKSWFGTLGLLDQDLKAVLHWKVRRRDFGADITSVQPRPVLELTVATDVPFYRCFSLGCLREGSTFTS